MTCIGVAANGEKHTLPAPLSMRLSCGQDAPADSFQGVFPGETEINFAFFLLYNEQKCLLFDGIVDEQTILIGASGRTTELVARSRAALLLDNEALPQTYYMPSLKTIFERHAAPYGFTGFRGNPKVFGGELCVKKGMSEWEVITLFCTSFLGVKPHISEGRILDATGVLPQGNLVISDTEGTACTELRERMKNCELLSELWVKSTRAEGYNAAPADPLAQHRGICRRRFLAAETDTRKLFATAHAKAYELTAICPGQPPCVLYTPVCVCQKDFHREGLYLAQLEYRISSSGETSLLRMKRKGDA